MSHEITPVHGELADILKKTANNTFPSGFMKLNGIVLPECYKDFIDSIENFQVRDDDIWVCSFPKTGTTWSQEMVWSILHDSDEEKTTIPLSKRFPYIEVSPMIDIAELLLRDPEFEITEDISNSVSYVDKLPSPRFIKTHLPFNLLPRQLRTGETRAKIIYIIRNPKDTCISYFHFFTLVGEYAGSLEDLCTLFVEDTIIYGPFWKHALSYWDRRTYENVLFLKFEDMKQDLPSVINTTAKFLGKNLTTDRLSALVDHLSYASMKNNPAANNEELVQAVQKIRRSKEKGEFMRSGEVSQWKTGMSSKDIERFDVWTRKNLEGTGLHY